MDKAKKEAIMNTRTFDELLDAESGKPGTPDRNSLMLMPQYSVLLKRLKRKDLVMVLHKNDQLKRIESN